MSGFSAVPLQLAIDPRWFVAAAVALFLLASVVGPLLALSIRETRPPTAAERDRLARLLAAAEYDPRRVLIVETAKEDSIQVSIRGPPGRRTLLVSESVLSGLDTDAAAALLAAEVERARHFYIEYRAVAAAVVVGGATAMFGGLVSFSDGLFGLAVAAVGLFWLGRQLQFRADSVAADRVGPRALADAFESVAARRGVEPETATWRTWFEVQPPLGQRIERLRNRS